MTDFQEDFSALIDRIKDEAPRTSPDLTAQLLIGATLTGILHELGDIKELISSSLGSKA